MAARKREKIVIEKARVKLTKQFPHNTYHMNENVLAVTKTLATRPRAISSVLTVGRLAHRTMMTCMTTPRLHKKMDSIINTGCVMAVQWTSVMQPRTTLCVMTVGRQVHKTTTSTPA
mmetsp:Transcript_48556/g.81012  ORF Transcript_48556/g.81012 Transcript_48556/m.81012 type:complete len:117 (-) Transcript_48556:15-365(-)